MIQSAAGWSKFIILYLGYQNIQLPGVFCHVDTLNSSNVMTMVFFSSDHFLSGLDSWLEFGS